MSIREPQIYLSSIDKEIIQIIADLIANGKEGSRGQNWPEKHVGLSSREAEHILSLLQKLRDSPDFFKRIYFTEAALGSLRDNPEKLKELYHAERVRRGRKRAMGRKHWDEFCARIGIGSSKALFRPVRVMDFAYFQKMEYKLLNELNVDPRVVEICLDLLEAERRVIEETRDDKRRMQGGMIRQNLEEVIKEVEENRRVSFAETLLSERRLVSLLFVVSDGSVIFTTRDWSAAGVLSQMAGAWIGLRGSNRVDI